MVEISFFDPSGAQGVTMSVCLCVRHKFVYKRSLKYFSLVEEDFNFTALLSVVAVGAL